MHIYFSGIGGAGIAPLALIAHQAGYKISGSDKQDSEYISYLKKCGISHIHIGQTAESIQKVHEKTPIDWLVYSSAIPREHPNHPELLYADQNHIKCSKRDEFLVALLQKSNQKLIAIAGTHGKSTTTAMYIWLCKQLGIPISYSVGAKLSFGDMGEFSADAEYFIYEADEYDRNFLSFHPHLAIIAGVDYDHADIYPSRADYYEAFAQFIKQSEKVIMWERDAHKIGVEKTDTVTLLPTIYDAANLHLTGKVNRQNAFLVMKSAIKLNLVDEKTACPIINKFPGLSRRFEQIVDGLYSDYAHTPEKIRGALQTAREHAGDNVVVVYEGLHNTRQHFIKDELPTLFSGVKKLYIAPSYLAREDENLELLTPDKLLKIIEKPYDTQPVKLDDSLKTTIAEHLDNDDLVLCLTAGGGGSLDEWLRKEFVS